MCQVVAYNLRLKTMQNYMNVSTKSGCSHIQRGSRAFKFNVEYFGFWTIIGRLYIG